MLATDLINGEMSAPLAPLLAEAKPPRAVPEPFASIGANAVMRSKKFRDGAER